MTRPCSYLWNLCGTLVVLTNAALAQDATGPQPAAIDFTFPIDAAQPVVGNASLGVQTTSAAPVRDAEAAYGNPIPQFLRDMFAGRDLPSVSAGHKVVTVPVNVENWLLLNWGDKVRVQLIEAHSDGDRNGESGNDSYKTLHCIQEAQVYALPNFAPDAGDEVPICLELLSSDARRLLSLRGKGRFILTVAHSEVSQPGPDTNLTRRSDWPVSVVATDLGQPVRKEGNSAGIELASLLKRLYPDASVEVIPVRDSVILRGTVTDAEHLTQIRQIAAQFAPTVHDQLKVVGTLAAEMIPAGFRVVSVPIVETQMLTGMLRAGNRVDVLVTFQRRDGAGAMQSRTVTLLENAEVFAPDSRPGERDRMALVSLLVRPEELNAIKLAQSHGNLSLAWRQPQQEASSQLNSSALQELEGLAGTRPVPNDSTVEKPGEDAAVPPPGNLQQIRDELRALHDDVRRLIEILERRNKDEPAATSQLTPAPAATDQAKGKLVGLFFIADWCGPCRQMAPVMARMKEQPDCEIRTIDIDTEPELAQIFAIHSLPTVVVLDGGREVDRIIGFTTEIRLKQALSRRADTSAEPSQTPTRDLACDMLGLTLSPLSPDRIGVLSPHRGGLEVIAVRPDSPAARQSIREGDVLVGLHVWETTSLDNVGFVLGHAELAEFMPLKFYLVRDRETLYGTLELDAVPAASRTDQSQTPAPEFIGELPGPRPTY